jgi:hypothetical protein
VFATGVRNPVFPSGSDILDEAKAAFKQRYEQVKGK